MSSFLFLAFLVLAFGLFGCVWSLFCHSFALLYLCPIMRASSGSNRSTSLHIGGRPAEGSESEQVGGASGGLPVVAVRALLVGHPSLPGKGKERISEIRYPTGSEYLRATMRCSDVVGSSRVEPSYAVPLVIDLQLVSMFGAQTFSPLTSSMFLRWFVFLRRPLRMVSASPCTISLSAPFNTSTYAQPRFPLTSGASWMASLLFSGIKVWGFPA